MIAGFLKADERDQGDSFHLTQPRAGGHEEFLKNDGAKKRTRPARRLIGSAFTEPHSHAAGRAFALGTADSIAEPAEKLPLPPVQVTRRAVEHQRPADERH